MRAELGELGMANGQHDGVVLAGVQIADRRDAVLVLRFGCVDPGVVHVHFGLEVGQLRDDVDHAGVAQIGAVFLEGQAQNEDTRAYRVDAVARHQAHHLSRHVGAHAVVDATTGEDHFRVVADFLRFVGEVIRIDADAVSAHQSGAERQEVPLRARGLENLQRIDAELVENQRQLVDQGDVDVALGVFDHFGGLGHPDAAGLVRAGGDDAGVERVDEVRCLGRGARGHLEDAGDPVQLVARVDALGAVAAVKVAVVHQAGCLLQQWHADFLGAAGIDGGFVHHHVALFQHAADGFAGLDQWRQVRALGGINRRGHGDDVHVAGGDVGQRVGVAQFGGAGQFFGAAFAGAVVAPTQFVDPGAADVVTGRVVLLAKLHGQRQSDIAQSDDRDVSVLGLRHGKGRFRWVRWVIGGWQAKAAEQARLYKGAALVRERGARRSYACAAVPMVTCIDWPLVAAMARRRSRRVCLASLSPCTRRTSRGSLGMRRTKLIRSSWPAWAE